MNDLLTRALRRETLTRPPVWFMRQAGRCLPAYREIRKRKTFDEIVASPDAAAEVTELPLAYFPVDALVLFKDLSTPFAAAGLEVELRPGVGPVVLPPFSGPGDFDRLQPFEPEDRLDFVLEAIRILAGRNDVPVLGFVGAPFTLCSYLLEGGRKDRLAQLRAFTLQRPSEWDRLASYWVEHLATFAIAQHTAGAAVIQVFDSWAGVLGPVEYRNAVLPYSRRLLEALAAAGVPTIHFATGNPALHPLLAEAGGDAIGVDWRQPLDEAWAAIGHDRAIQGNLDPAVMLADRDTAIAATRDLLARSAGRPGHIVNVGHGLLPDSDPAIIAAVVETVRHAADV